MSYAVRKDNQGWRTVDSKSDISDDEFFSESKPDISAHDGNKSIVELNRLVAYADPITGSDRLFVEAQRMQMMGEDGWQKVRDAAAARYLEIQEAHPWP